MSPLSSIMMRPQDRLEKVIPLRTPPDPAEQISAFVGAAGGTRQPVCWVPFHLPWPQRSLAAPVHWSLASHGPSRSCQEHLWSPSNRKPEMAPRTPGLMGHCSCGEKSTSGYHHPTAGSASQGNTGKASQNIPEWLIARDIGHCEIKEPPITALKKSDFFIFK